MIDDTVVEPRSGIENSYRSGDENTYRNNIVHSFEVVDLNKSVAAGTEDEPWLRSQHLLESSFAESRSLLRNIWTQIVITSLIATLSRGTLNALNAVGGLGTGDVQTATLVNLLSSVSFSCLSWMTGGIVVMIGCRKACALGSFTTAFTLSTLMLYTMFHLVPVGVVWVAAVTDGIGSGILWTASGTITIKYPPETRKGFASTILFAIYSIGAALGGLTAFAMNINESSSTSYDIMPALEDNFPLQPMGSSGLQPKSYAVMVGFAIIALCLSVLILPESEVRNSDGSRLQVAPSPLSSPVERNMSRTSRISVASRKSAASSFRLFSSNVVGRESSSSPRAAEMIESSSFIRSTMRELHQLTVTLEEVRVQLLILYCFASLFHQTYLFNGINYKAFNVRTRGLNCFMYWIGRVPAGFFHGYVVDDIRFSTRQRGMHGLVLLLTHVALCQCLTVLFWTAVPAGKFDVIVDPVNTALAFANFYLYGALDTISQSFALWLFSVLARRHPSRIPHYVAVFRSFQGFGMALAWFLDLNSLSSHYTQFLVCGGCWLLSLPGLIWVVYNLPRHDAPSRSLVYPTSSSKSLA